MKNKKKLLKELLKEKDGIIHELPFTFNSIFLIEVESEIRPAYTIKGRNMRSIQNSNMLVKGNGIRIPISKFIIT